MPKRSASRSSSPFSRLALLIAVVVIIFLIVLQQRKPPINNSQYLSPGLHQQNPAWSVYFSPDGGCTDAIVDALTQAKKTVLVQAYSFTSTPIARALRDAKDRGINVEVILDESNRTDAYSAADFISHAGIPTYIDAVHNIAHNKIMIIDNTTVITGSFNFTKSAEEKNAENLLVIHDTALAKRYTDNWQKHLEHSEPYTR
jgi:phosphatidylserine/phosphatidylglycerophosphate/cardiolipin synthase-like enzyme